MVNFAEEVLMNVGMSIFPSMLVFHLIDLMVTSDDTSNVTVCPVEENELISKITLDAAEGG
jgi:hypothetical protein